MSANREICKSVPSPAINNAGAREGDSEGDKAVEWGLKNPPIVVTYKILEYSKQLSNISEVQQRLALQFAFNKFRAISKLTFLEMTREPEFVEVIPKEIIGIKWAKGDHGGSEDHPFDGPGGVLGHVINFKAGKLGGEIHFDDDENWSRDKLTWTAMHEIGHAIGLIHSDNPKSIMRPTIQHSTDLQPDDIAAVQKLYGPYPDDNKYTVVMGENIHGQGIATFDLRDQRDQGFALDGDLGGGEFRKGYYIVFYRPGTGTLFIMEPKVRYRGNFKTTWEHRTSFGKSALLSDSKDRAFEFDYESTGLNDHIVLYRPGSGKLCIVKYHFSGHHVGLHTVVYETDAGFEHFDMKSDNVKAFAFDYDKTGHTDHLVLYSPGTGLINIVKTPGRGQKWISVYLSKNGIDGFSLNNEADLGFALDYNHTGKLDHLVFYRPGSGSIYILGHENGAWTAKYHQSDPGSGIGGFDLGDRRHLAYALDYNGTGHLDHIVLYGPGTGTFWILAHAKNGWYPVYAQGNHDQPGKGVGTYDLTREADRSFAYDYGGSGRKDRIVLYRPNEGIIYILIKNTGITEQPGSDV